MTEDKGLYGKYEVRRRDGKPMNWCFVLEIHDPIARVALSFYAAECVRVGKLKLARDLYELLDAYEKGEEPDA